jgi:signal transduction histidine kinase
MVSVRAALDTVATSVHELPVTVTVTSAWAPAATMKELAWAVREALDNVVHHANATRATVYAETLDGELVISVRDDGVGFAYDEQRLVREGKLGLSRA